MIIDGFTSLLLKWTNFSFAPETIFDPQLNTSTSEKSCLRGEIGYALPARRFNVLLETLHFSYIRDRSEEEV